MTGTGTGTGLLLAVLVLGVTTVAAPQAPASAQAAQLDQLRFCRDANGERLTGDIDILLLLDDTLTLRRQDPDQTRFAVIRSFLEGITAIESNQTVNFATYVFGNDATPVLDFAAIDRSDIDRIDAQIRANNPAQQNTTNFIRAITRASQSLNARPAQNCRILLWFTDGNHDANDDFTPAADAQESQELQEAFCAPDGLAQRVRAQRINTFVLLLDPPPLQPLRLEASKDIFQVLTGDPKPGFPDESRLERSPSGGCAGPLGEQLGKIFAVDKSDQLIAIIADFLHELEDGGVITAETCPYPDEPLDSLELPDAHLVDWISATDFSTGTSRTPPDISRLTVVTSDGQQLQAGDVMDVIWTSGPSARFRVRESQRELLGSGWIVRAREAVDLCLRSRAVDLSFRLSTGEPSVAVVAPRGLPARLWDEGQLRYVARDGRRLTLEEALRSPDVRGRLAIASGLVFSPDSELPVNVLVDGAPVRGELCSVLEIPLSASLSAGGGLLRAQREAPMQPVIGSECLVTPATRGDDGGSLDFTATLAGLAELRADERCDIGDDWHVLIDGQRLDGTVTSLSAGAAPVRFTLASGVAPPNERRDCIGRPLPPVELAWQGQTVAIPASVTAEWERRGDAGIASGFTVLALLIAVAASYGLLWLLNWLLLRPPAGNTLQGFDVPARLQVDQRGRVSLDWSEGRPESFTGILENGSGGGAGVLIIGRNRFTRNLPFNPLKEPTLLMQRGQAAVTAVSFPRVGAGIPISFPELVVLSTMSTSPAEPDRPIDVTFTVLVQRVRKTSLEQVFSQVEGRKNDLAGRMQQMLASRQGSAAASERSRRQQRDTGRDREAAATARPRPNTANRTTAPSPRARPGGSQRSNPPAASGPRGPQATPPADGPQADSRQPDSPRQDGPPGGQPGGRKPRPRPPRQ